VLLLAGSGGWPGGGGGGGGGRAPAEVPHKVRKAGFAAGIRIEETIS
jgi:hypothetical protein